MNIYDKFEKIKSIYTNLNDAYHELDDFANEQKNKNIDDIAWSIQCELEGLGEEIDIIKREVEQHEAKTSRNKIC